MISSVTDAVADEFKAWQSRPLEPVYPIVYLDCIHVKVRDTGAVRAKAVYLAIGINMNGESESRYFCRKIFSDILLEKIGKITRPLMPSAAPIRPRHLFPTQQGVGT